MPGSHALRRLALVSTAGAGIALLGLSVDGMAGLDARLADAARARDSVKTQLVVDRHHDGDCPFERDAPGVSPTPDGRDY